MVLGGDMLSLEPYLRANQKEGASWQELAWRSFVQEGWLEGVPQERELSSRL